VGWVLHAVNPHLRACRLSTLEFAMNIELDEVVVQDISDDELELAAGAQQGAASFRTHVGAHCCL